MISAPKILLFGGTTEGKATANWLNDMGFTFFYSTKMPSKVTVAEGCEKLQGAMTAEEMALFCQSKAIELIIDAAHPYAYDLHQNIASAAGKLNLPVVRMERGFMEPVDDPLVTYVDSLEEMVETVGRKKEDRVLSLMGVKSVSHLHNALGTKHTWYRILDQASSWKLALESGVSEEHIIASRAFENLNDAKALIEEHQIQMMLTKDSGYNGLFDHKIELARQFNIPLVVLKRPPMPEYTRIVKCRADLRQFMQQQGDLPKAELAHGFTTGTCATICAKAAATFLLKGLCPANETILLPDGESCTMAIHTQGLEGGQAFATVIKNSGDDPDLTDGLVIGCRISYNPMGDIRFVEGEGVGTVRLPGLGLPIGGPAINKVPREMISGELSQLMDDYELTTGFDVSVFIPQGRRLAARTFNPRLGVEGGLSIIGSTGRIKPFSTEAYVATIQRQIGVALDNNGTHIVMNSGGRSEKYLKSRFTGLQPYAFVQYGNYIGEALKAVGQPGIRRVTMGIMTGKAVKLADGHLDTHSRNVVMNKSFIAQLALHCGYDADVIEQIKNIVMARELETIIPFQVDEPFFKAIKSACYKAVEALTMGFELEILLINNEGVMI